MGMDLIGKRREKTAMCDRKRPHDATFLTTKEAATFLKLRPNILEKMRVSGGGPAFRHHGRSVRYHLGDLLTWSDDNRKRSTPDE